MAKTPNIMNELSVVSYNIWFEELAELERIVSLLSTIRSSNPDVVCLQEVKPYIYNTLINDLQEYKYHYPKRVDARYGCVIFSKHPITMCMTHEFESTMGRKLYIAKIEYPFHSVDPDGIGVETREVVVATTHFESMFKRKVENIIKIQQFREAHKALNNMFNKYGNVVFCADTNIILEEEEKFIATDPSSDWKDAWKLKGDNHNKFTFDGQRNLYLQLTQCPYRSRLDRVLFRANQLNITSFRMLKKGDGLTEPSDHFGVYAKFTIT